jgi:hypothetical protein
MYKNDIHNNTVKIRTAKIWKELKCVMKNNNTGEQLKESPFSTEEGAGLDPWSVYPHY